jgi:transcriptional regulator of acetoin/glycerol metabolism
MHALRDIHGSAELDDLFDKAIEESKTSGAKLDSCPALTSGPNLANGRLLGSSAEGSRLEVGLGVVPSDGLAGLKHLCPASIGDAPEGDRERLIRTLSVAKWNKSRAARELHWSRTTVYRKMKRYQIA